jgi:hypothetical protein
MEAGLDEKKKRLAKPWIWSAAAVVTLVIFTRWWSSSENKPGNTENYSASTKRTVQVKKADFPLAVLDLSSPVKKNVFTPKIIHGNEIPVAFVQRDTSKEKELPEQKTVEQEPVQEPVAIKTATRKSRFVELDFSDGITPGTTYSEPATASHTLKFKLGIGQNQSTTVQNNPKRFVGFRQPL